MPSAQSVCHKDLVSLLESTLDDFLASKNGIPLAGGLTREEEKRARGVELDDERSGKRKYAACADEEVVDAASTNKKVKLENH
jgi:hypothetical protein